MVQDAYQGLQPVEPIKCLTQLPSNVRAVTLTNVQSVDTVESQFALPETLSRWLEDAILAQQVRSQLEATEAVKAKSPVNPGSSGLVAAVYPVTSGQELKTISQDVEQIHADPDTRSTGRDSAFSVLTTPSQFNLCVETVKLSDVAQLLLWPQWTVDVWLFVQLAKYQTTEGTNIVQSEEFEESNTAFPHQVAWLELLNKM